MSTDPADPYDPAVRGRNLRLALVVGGCAAAVLVAALVRFIVFGLPEEAGAHKQQEQRRSATEPTVDEAETP